MLVINPIGGLANRMRAIASALALADSTGRKLRVVWAVNLELGARFEDLFRPESLPAVVDNISARRQVFFWDPARKKNLGLSKIYKAFRFKRVLFLENQPDPQKLIDDIKSCKGDVLIQSFVDFFPFPGDMYRQIFVPQPDIIDRVDIISSRFGEVTVGCHIRRTDNSESIARSPLWLFTKRMEESLRKNPDTKFYVASDDASIKDQLQLRFGPAVIISEQPLDRDSVAGMKSALTEMLLLSRTSEICGSYWSSYSEAAALLGDISIEQLSICR